jgi:hypothetical protein
VATTETGHVTGRARAFRSASSTMDRARLLRVMVRGGLARAKADCGRDNARDAYFSPRRT